MFRHRMVLITIFCLITTGIFPVLSFGQTPMTDEEITEAVEHRLRHDSLVPYDRIDVVTLRGVVTLTGQVSHLPMKRRAGGISERVKHVRSVVNRIDVAPPPRDDNLVKTDVKSLLNEHPVLDASAINATVDNGVVTLTGNCTSWHDRALADYLAASVRGVKQIRNDITVRSGDIPSDMELTVAVERRLRRDARIDHRSIDVCVDDGVVTLTGTVRSAAEKVFAANASLLSGVRGVDTTGLEVQWKDYAVTLPEDLNEPIVDAVTDALRLDPQISAGETIHVTAVGGVVTLSGVVDNMAAKDAAEQDARNTTGVRHVRNRLKVRPLGPVPADDAIARRVRHRLRTHAVLHRQDIDVHVDRGTVYLSGRVDSLVAREMAEDSAASVRGVTDVVNGLVTRTVSNMEDRPLENAIEFELSWCPCVTAGQVHLAVRSGIAYLAGTVDTWEERQAAHTCAIQAGALSVRNYLRVRNQTE